jgi:hypothetical protein
MHLVSLPQRLGPLPKNRRGSLKTRKNLRLLQSTHLIIIIRHACWRSSLLTLNPSFINSQLQLEADAREVLPYVSSPNLEVLPVPFLITFRRSILALNL